jgi:hypothetical protein
MMFGREVMSVNGTLKQYFNPIASTTLKWLRFKFKTFNLAQQWLGIGDQGMYFTKGSEIILNYMK